MALEVVVLDKDEYKALIDNQTDKDELEYLKACQYALESFNRVRGLCPKPKSCGRTKSNIFSVIRKYYKNLETY